MKHKVAELEGALLDAAVAQGMGRWHMRMDDGVALYDSEKLTYSVPFAPSTSWSDGGPIIERELLRVEGWGKPGPKQWYSHHQTRPVLNERDCPTWCMYGPTPLVAAMRAFVASKFGEEVEL